MQCNRYLQNKSLLAAVGTRVRINYVKALVVVLFLRKQPIPVSLVVTININIINIIAIVVPVLYTSQTGMKYHLSSDEI